MAMSFFVPNIYRYHTSVDIRAEGPSVRPAQGNALGYGKTTIYFSAQRANRSPSLQANYWPVGPIAHQTQ
jgi:hypothetical protein